VNLFQQHKESDMTDTKTTAPMTQAMLRTDMENFGIIANYLVDPIIDRPLVDQQTFDRDPRRAIRSIWLLGPRLEEVAKLILHIQRAARMADQLSDSHGGSGSDAELQQVQACYKDAMDAADVARATFVAAIEAEALRTAAPLPF
jgi:hypothetical protein